MPPCPDPCAAAVGEDGLCLWTLYSAYVLVSRDPLRLRIAMDESGRSWLRRGLAAGILLHWAWQVFYLTRA